ncbi:hypothetical protein [Paenarthrobacter sp. PH39-S1]|uniref:hypothetical protein n=1 Tax=Paenarthrobacter sp. PH39-S1 TaxID=3046204 RepID=UPI0024BB77BF|nr:hypothetical protein [Paenarthrobacter sp. PH39-S1]MDJ0356321.1 hypothetical protein [Paenarthrobacter sp. PH39-S1]
METLSITTPADVISYIILGLGSRTTESLVLITSDNKQTGATLRIGPPASDGDMIGYAWKVTGYFAADLNAPGVAFAIFTDVPGQQVCHDRTRDWSKR